MILEALGASASATSHRRDQAQIALRIQLLTTSELPCRCTVQGVNWCNSTAAEFALGAGKMHDEAAQVDRAPSIS